MIHEPDSVTPARLKAISDPTRYRILEFLVNPVANCCSRDDGVCACDLGTYLGMSQPTISHHMKQLVDAGLIRAERRGRWVYYELEYGTFRELASALQAFAEAGADSRADARVA